MVVEDAGRGVGNHQAAGFDEFPDGFGFGGANCRRGGHEQGLILAKLALLDLLIGEHVELQAQVLDQAGETQLGTRMAPSGECPGVDAGLAVVDGNSVLLAPDVQ